MRPCDGEPRDSTDFSLVLGGPLYQLFLRSGLAKPPLDLLRRRVLALPLLTWLPLLVLSALEGQAVAGVRLPFLQDLEAQARFLLALPLLIVAEVLVHRRLAPAVRLFVEKGIVRPEDRKRFDAILASTMRLRNSVAIEVVLIAFVLSAGHYLWREQVAIRAETWYAVQTPQGLALSLAGKCYAWFSLPIFQFILIRWYYRLVLWGQFLWRVSRLDLDLRPAHPDRAGGLGFLGTSTYAFAPLLLGQSVIVSAMIAGRILHEGAQLPAFKYEIAGALVLALLQALGPAARLRPGPPRGQASGAPRVRPPGGPLRPGVRPEVAVRRGRSGRGARGHRRHPVPRRPREQLRGGQGGCARFRSATTRSSNCSS